MNNEILKVYVEPVILIGDKERLFMYMRYETVEAANADLIKMRKEDECFVDLEVIEAFELIADNEDKYFENSLPFYLTKEEAIKHYNEKVYNSHIVDAVDTEGHTYECTLCNYHYYVFDPFFKEEPCPAERILIV